MSERIGIAGGGAIASGLACVAAEHGQVVLWARRPDAATAKVERLIEKRGGLGAGNVSVSDDLDSLLDATFVVEAIAEEHDAKVALLRRLGGAATNGTILATTTSALSVSALAEATGRPDRFVGLHVFNPVPKMDLVELVFPAAADAETRDARPRAVRGARQGRRRGPRHARLRRQPAAVPVPVRRGGGCSSETGLEPQAIDDCMRMGAGHPMGPLALLDYVGLDVSAAIGRSIGARCPRASRR